MSKKIEPCKVCGSNAGIYRFRGHKLFRVCCQATDSNYLGTEGVIDDWCETEVEPAIWYESEAEAIAAWNTRTVDPEVKRLREDRDKWRAIVADVQEARVLRNIGVTGGGSPAIYYPTEAIGEAVAGLGKNSLALTGQKG